MELFFSGNAARFARWHRFAVAGWLSSAAMGLRDRWVAYGQRRDARRRSRGIEFLPDHLLRDIGLSHDGFIAAVQGPMGGEGCAVNGK